MRRDVASLLNRACLGGSINRADIVNCFAVSIPGAPKDLALYQERSPGNMQYDTRGKRYVPAEKFILQFLDPAPYVYLAQLRSVAEGGLPAHNSWTATLSNADVALTPKRDIDTAFLCWALNTAREGDSVEIFYQSITEVRSDPIWHRTTPHAVGFDGFRWPAQAYCHLENRLKDVLLVRFLKVHGKGKPGLPCEQDWLWNCSYDVIIRPHPDLTVSQKNVVTKNYRIALGNSVLPIQHAMLFYIPKELGLLGSTAKQSARPQHAVAINREQPGTAFNKAELQMLLLYHGGASIDGGQARKH
ncbi:transcriptional regulator [Methylobacterium sp. V23]|uniref:transcriptional regulator n=1 Tax=Methylobacterium sp. V23 TaxID=2044878 RepID=UPI001FDF2D1C|nr:transcriptional regulator [Methylobacterium sp. V23]